jgi:hypothetical protein
LDLGFRILGSFHGPGKSLGATFVRVIDKVHIELGPGAVELGPFKVHFRVDLGVLIPNVNQQYDHYRGNHPYRPKQFSHAATSL